MGKLAEDKPHRAFEAFVDGRRAEVWWRPETHSYGEWNGADSHYWLKYPHTCPPEHVWKPFLCANPSDRVFLWSVRVREWQNTSARGGNPGLEHGVGVTLKCNGIPVYAFSVLDLAYAFAKAQLIISELEESPVPLQSWERDALPETKVWWRGQPAILGLFTQDGSSIRLTYDREDGDAEGFDTGRPHWSEEDRSAFGGVKLLIVEDVLSPDIDWFRA